MESNPFPGYIAVALSGSSPDTTARLNTLTTADLVDSALLKLKTSGRKISIARYIGPQQSGFGMALFLFPRPTGKASITVEERQIEFHSAFPEGLRLRKNFKLEKMLYQGKLEV